MWLADHLDAPSDLERKPLVGSCHNASLRLFRNLAKGKNGYKQSMVKCKSFSGKECKESRMLEIKLVFITFSNLYFEAERDHLIYLECVGFKHKKGSKWFRKFLA